MSDEKTKTNVLSRRESMNKYVNKTTEDKYDATTSHFAQDKSIHARWTTPWTMDRFHELYMSEPVKGGARLCHTLCSLGTISTLCLLLFIIWLLAKVESCNWPVCETFDEWMPTDQSKKFLQELPNWYAKHNRGVFFNIVAKIAPGVGVKMFVDWARKSWSRFQTYHNFLRVGFKDRVSITINTLVTDKDDKRTTEFEMRTIKDVDLSELVPNKAAETLVKAAGKSILWNESGPKVYTIKKEACFGSTILQSVFCLRAYRKTFCCGTFSRCNSFVCGRSEAVCLDFDPILRFEEKNMGAKKFIVDQIKNLLSEATTGKSFVGWEMASDSYEKKTYHWCLTFEQPMSTGNGKEIFQKKNHQNRKFRILLVSEETLALSIKKMPDEVFVAKTPTGEDGYTKYCDRRWLHIRTMAELECMQKGMKICRNNEDPRKIETVKIEDETWRKKARKWAQTFFVDKLEVVVPKNQVPKLNEHIRMIQPALRIHSNRIHMSKSPASFAPGHEPVLTETGTPAPNSRKAPGTPLSVKKEL